jgi:hypothetical protein
MVHDPISMDEARREEIEREARGLGKVERNLNDIRLKFGKQGLRL